jgi:hypothetical protein
MRAGLEKSFPLGPVAVDPKNPPAHLKKFFAWAKANCVRVVGGWAPLLMKPEYVREPWLYYFASLRKLHIENGGVSLGTPTDYFQPIDYMFDNALHDNEMGRARASAVLARDLCRIRACPTAEQSAAVSPTFTSRRPFKTGQGTGN